MKRLIGLLLALIVVAAGLSFAMLNPTPVSLDFYLGQLNLPVSLWLVIAFAIGVIIGLAAATGRRDHRARGRHRHTHASALAADTSAA